MNQPQQREFDKLAHRYQTVGLDAGEAKRMETLCRIRQAETNALKDKLVSHFGRQNTQV